MKLKYMIILLVALLMPALTMAQSFSITSNPVLTGEVNTQYQYQVAVNNPDNYTLDYSVEGPSGMSISNSGLVSFIPTSQGIFDVNITVSNTTNSTSQTYQLQVTAVPSQFSANALELGSDSQVRDSVITTTYQIANTGSFDITNLEVEFVNVPTRYNLQINLPGTTIPAKGNITAQVTAQVPLTQDAGRVRIGQLIIRGESENTINPLTRDVFLTAENKLVIESIEVTIAGRRERLDSPGAIRREANLGDDIEITLRIRNDFENMEFEDVEAELFSLDLDDADGQTATLRRFRAGRTSTDLKFSFTLNPDRVEIDDAPFDLEILLFGIDENNARHGETWVLELEIERQSRDVRFTSTNIAPATVTCQNTFFTIDTQVRNIGLRDLTNSMVQVNIPRLGIQEFRRGLDMYTGDSRRVSFSLNIPQNTAPGQYTVELYAHPTTSTSDFTDAEVLTLTVGNCPTTTQNGGSNNGNVNNGGITIQPSQNESVVVGRPVTSQQTSNANVYVAILGVLVVVLFVTLIVVLLRVL
jgi:hypothetical protein